ncbi:DUF6768 family protein [Cognatishimia sp. D5M38]|uniref:Uncharacterized protein n=2 Tax=Cognatishimia TaxID=2211635 RepID=A0A975EPS1_9RHOB|nr:DUF6768 family protein [Cognatishimia activa]QTN35955.1 hypothetical protein HZ995_00015 [Cognatishimia activa]
MSSKNDLDRMIEDALKGQDSEILRETQELGWFQLGLSQFGGKLGWVTWVVMIVQIALFAVGLYCAVQFFGATEAILAVKWGVSGGVLILMATQLKLSLMPQLQADRVIREVKRLQLIMARND